MNAQELIAEHLDIWTTAQEPKKAGGRGRGKKKNGQILYGIKKLRELILDLAVRGKLVEQNPEDESASVLLDKIAKEKAHLIKEGKIKKQKKLPEITDEEKPFALPDGWEWVRLGEVTNYGNLLKAEAKNVKETDWVLELEDVEKETSKLLQKIRFVDRNFRSSKNLFCKGDVVYGKLRPYLDKVIVADEDGVCSTEMIPIRGHRNLLPTFLRMVLKSPYFIRYANKSTHGMNLPRMGTVKARLALFPICSEFEQHRIVAKVHELMALCDQLEQQQTTSNATQQTLLQTLLAALTGSADHKSFTIAWKRIATHFDLLFITEQSIDQLKQTILQLAVMGKLVPQSPEDEPASVLLGKIAKEKTRLIKEGQIKKQKKLPKITEEEKPFALPDGWEWSRFADVTQEISTGPFGTMIHKSDYVEDGVPLVNPSHMINSIIVEDHKVAVSAEKAEELKSYFLHTGDIVMARRGEMGRCALVCEREDGWLCGTGSFVLRFHSDIYRRYFLLLFQTNHVRKYLGGKSVGMTMTNLNHSILNKMPVLLPPVLEQHRIVSKVDELMALCDQLKSRLHENQTTKLQLADTVANVNGGCHAG